MDINQYTDHAGAFALPQRVQTAFCDRDTTVETAQDFVLPDYLPEIRKLLRVTPTVLPPSRYLGTGEAEFSGGVTLEAMYIGADQALYRTELSAPYSFRIPLEDAPSPHGTEPLCVHADITPEAVMTRVSAPRKLHIKCRLRAHVVGLCDEEVDTTVSGESTDPASIERLERTHTCGRVVRAAGEVLELNDELSVPTGAGELRLIGNDGTVQISELAPTEDGIACRGELIWHAMVCRDRADGMVGMGDMDGMDSMNSMNSTGGDVPAGDVEVLTRRMPFSQTVALPAPLTGEPEIMAHGICTGITARVEEGRLMASATLVVQVTVQCRERVTFVCDCYSTERESVSTPRRFEYARALACLNGNVSESGSVRAAECGMPQDAAVLDVAADAVPTGLTCERGRATLGGECHYRVLYRTAQGELGHAEFSLPLRYELPADFARGMEGEEACEVEAHMVLLAARMRAEGDGFAVDAEWGIAARVYAPAAAEAVGEVSFADAHPTGDASCVICYPDASASLWGVAKRYHAALRPLAAQNHLAGAADPASAQSLEGVRFLMIG